MKDDFIMRDVNRRFRADRNRTIMTVLVAVVSYIVISYTVNSCTAEELVASMWTCQCEAVCDEHSVSLNPWPVCASIDKTDMEVDAATSCFATMASLCDDYTCDCACTEEIVDIEECY